MILYQQYFIEGNISIMVNNYIPPKDTIVIQDGKIFLNKKELPPLPRGNKIKGFPVVLNEIPYINGYELINGKWKRTMRAFMLQYIR
jgi:hypothetical protein